MRPTDCEVCAEGRAAMDAVNELGPEEAALLAPALEKMPQLTFLGLSSAQIGSSEPGARGGFAFWGAVWVCG
jgi:hypothetical protein